MKAFAATLLCSVVLAVAGTGSAAVPQTLGERVRLVRHGKDVPGQLSKEFTANLIALLQSCEVETTAQFSVSLLPSIRPETWQQQLGSDSFVYVAFSASRMLTVARMFGGVAQANAPRPIDEILLPLPEGRWPAHIFVKSNGKVFSFAMMDAAVLKKIAFEPAVGLASVAPYDYLAKAIPEEFGSFR